MQRLLSLLLLASLAAPAPAAGLLIPADGPALQMVAHTVSVAIDEQAAVTDVEQTFRNPSDRALEATFVFPVPKGASVDRFSVWLGGKPVKAEVVEADRARSLYTGIVRRLQDPALLEYVGSGLLRLRVYPVPAHGDQKVAVRFTSLARRDAGLAEYVYPLKTADAAARTLEAFRIDVRVKSKSTIHNVYSPTHAVTVEHAGDRAAHAWYEQKQGVLDRDFQLFYALGAEDVGLTALMHRPDRDLPGSFLMLISPRAELGKVQKAPRDMVFVLDTSGSMSGVKMQQARNALRFCLGQLGGDDRFNVVSFATEVRSFRDGLAAADAGHVAAARKWVDGLEATGGTAIDAALKAALDLRPADAGRTFTVVFFTDGEPTVGVTNPEKIVQGVKARNTAQTRIFTFGVGDDVHATLLDRLAEETRAVSTYVRPAEDIEVKVSSLYAKISHPVLTDLRLSAGEGVRLQEVYPGQLPDLFHGGQVVVLGRYTGHGHKTVTLTGKVGGQAREFVHEVHFPAQTGEERAFVEGLWARRKVGCLLDEIRRNGEKKELTDEVVKLARKHGITTPYTSYLVVPDGVAQPPAGTFFGTGPIAPTSPVAIRGFQASDIAGNTTGAPAPEWYDGFPPGAAITFGAPAAAAPYVPGAPAPSVAESLMGGEESATPSSSTATQLSSSQQQQYRAALAQNQAGAGKLGVDFALELNALRTQSQLGAAPAKTAFGRTCRQVGAAWVDEGFDGKQKAVQVKAMSKAYFRLLERQPKLKEVFALGKTVVWVTPSGAVLVVAPGGGQETMSDGAIDRLFARE
jgi:Ca-activated chloride channel family protein